MCCVSICIYFNYSFLDHSPRVTSFQRRVFCGQQVRH